ncbi:heme-binding protein [Sphingomonas sp. 28-62-11]|uniref:GlcG/HbpS family heme-binding protein n=1 Tax=Sphingomonas sp. 28-62-11 TaxID=1970432 RepID=UPI000BD059B4|nr:MAG: hypothetical protein B7Y49_01870 [Sphingomonas sp. 28-62-11]
MMRVIFAALALVAAPAVAQQATPVSAAPATTPAQAPAPPYGASITLAEAQRLVDRALAAGRARGLRIAVAIVEPSASLVAFARLDDTQYGSILVAQEKAGTAARFRTPTAAMAKAVLEGRVTTLALPGAVPIAGGRPIIVGGKIIGAIGISGATSAEDDEIAGAALADLR